MTFNQGQGHIDKRLTVEFGSIYHYTKFEPNWFIHVRMHANFKGFLLLFWMQSVNQQ